MGAAALNFNDIDRCRGTLVSVSRDPPFTLGMDLCGVVTHAGKGAEEWVGRRVVAVSTDALGGIAEYTVRRRRRVRCARVARRPRSRGVPPAVPHDAARAVPPGPAHAGETVLVHSGASGLGTAAIQLGAAAGAASSQRSAARRRPRSARPGRRAVIDHTSEDFVEVVLGATDEVGADVICDLAGGDFVRRRGSAWLVTAATSRWASPTTTRTGWRDGRCAWPASATSRWSA